VELPLGDLNPDAYPPHPTPHKQLADYNLIALTNVLIEWSNDDSFDKRSYLVKAIKRSYQVNINLALTNF